ncbi:PRC-barrel domain containing protein [Halorubrum sp. HHNYT27]|uniref:PRC-barrel domain containing protein n=1 Tax=Halorubrum sp. HHNYT27 TaxID=3402275 RepID=UPI003EBA253C
MDITEHDEGKKVVNAAGKKLGMVSKVEGQNVHVDPDPGLTDTIKSKLGWGDADEDTYALNQSDIATVTDDEVRLNR